MGLRLITPPAVEPVTLAEAKAHLRVSIPDDDTLIAVLISAARQNAENYMNRQIITATWEVTFDAFPVSGMDYYNARTSTPAAGTNAFWPASMSALNVPKWFFELPYPALQSVVSITYVDPTGNTQTLDPAIYQVDSYTEPGRVFLAPGKMWPALQRQPNAVVVRFKSGFGDAETSVPESIRQWILIRVGTLYENRQEVVNATHSKIQELPRDFVDCLLDDFYVPGLP